MFVVDRSVVFGVVLEGREVLAARYENVVMCGRDRNVVAQLQYNGTLLNNIT